MGTSQILVEIIDLIPEQVSISDYTGMVDYGNNVVINDTLPAKIEQDIRTYVDSQNGLGQIQKDFRVNSYTSQSENNSYSSKVWQYKIYLDSQKVIDSYKVSQALSGTLTTNENSSLAKASLSNISKKIKTIIESAFKSATASIVQREVNGTTYNIPHTPDWELTEDKDRKPFSKDDTEMYWDLHYQLKALGSYSQPVGNTQSQPATQNNDTPTTQAPVGEIKGKIILTKKSGPGEITGIVEQDIIDLDTYPNVTFSGIQFTQEGDYVISVSSAISGISPKEFSVKVLPEPKIIPQEETRGNEKSESNGTRPCITQIDQPSITIPPITIDLAIFGNPKLTPDKVSDVVSGIGLTPFIWYNGYQFEERYVSKLRLYHEGIIPKIEFVFQDTLNILKGPGAPQDDTTMDFFLNSNTDNLKSIHFKFKIEKCARFMGIGERYSIKGTIDVPNLYIIKNKAYTGTSFEVLREVCKELGLGFNSNIDNTTDSMGWRNTNNKPYTFIEDVIKHSYINDESFMAGYIDYNYCFNYVDVEKEMKRDNSTDKGIDSSGNSKAATPDETNRVVDLVLTNDKSALSSCLYFEKFTTRNDSTSKSLKEGYQTRTKSYDRINKVFHVFDVDSTTSDGDKTIILKGKTGESEFFRDNIKTVFTGKLDTDNTHKDYNYAKTQNSINLRNLNKIAIILTLPNPNLNLYKLMKIKVIVTNESGTPAEKDLVNWRYTGDYIIADIEYTWDGSRMKQLVRCVRKELGKEPDESLNKPTEPKVTESKEFNQNPITETLRPNEAYVVGETYTVKDKDDNLYSIVIQSLSDNGTDVVGVITKLN